MTPDFPDTPQEWFERLVLAGLLVAAAVGMCVQADRLGRRLGGSGARLPPVPNRVGEPLSDFSPRADLFLATMGEWRDHHDACVWLRDGQPIQDAGYSRSYTFRVEDVDAELAAVSLFTWQAMHPENPWPCGPPDRDGAPLR